MPSRRSVLASASGAVAATLGGCSALESDGGGDRSASGGPTNARRWLTGEVARIPYEDPPPVGESPEEPLLRQLTTRRPSRVQSVEGLSAEALQRVGNHGTVGNASIPIAQAEEITSMLGRDAQIEVGLGEFGAPEPPETATREGSYRGASLYALENSNSVAAFGGSAIADGTYAHVPRQPTADDATSALHTLLDAEAGEGTPIEGDDVDRIWSYLQRGFFELYYAWPGDGGGISLRADGEVVHRRSIRLQHGKSEAEEAATWIEQSVAESGSGDGERAPSDFGPYDDVTVTRDGRAVMVEGSLPASAVAAPEFLTP